MITDKDLFSPIILPSANGSDSSDDESQDKKEKSAHQFKANIVTEGLYKLSKELKNGADGDLKPPLREHGQHKLSVDSGSD